MPVTADSILAAAKAIANRQSGTGTAVQLGTLADSTGTFPTAQQVICRRLFLGAAPEEIGTLDRVRVRDFVQQAVAENAILIGDEETIQFTAGKYVGSPQNQAVLTALHTIADSVRDVSTDVRFGFYGADFPQLGVNMLDDDAVWTEVENQRHVFDGILAKCTHMVESAYWYPNHNWTNWGHNILPEIQSLLAYGKPVLAFVFPGMASDTDSNHAAPLPGMILEQILMTLRRLGTHPTIYGDASVMPTDAGWVETVKRVFAV